MEVGREGHAGREEPLAVLALRLAVELLPPLVDMGERTMFETIVSVTAPKHEVRIESDAENLDGLN